MKKKRGFTLVELLVVISIIALLMAILMPALASVKRQARAAACLSNLRQWGVVFTLFLGDNNGYFNKGDLKDPRAKDEKIATESEVAHAYWLGAYLPYYKDPVLLCCPAATRMQKGGNLGTWKIRAENLFKPIKALCRYAVNPANKQATIYGSYTYNRWLTNPPGKNILTPENYFRTSSSLKEPGNIPVLCDVFGTINGLNCWWINPKLVGKASLPRDEGANTPQEKTAGCIANSDHGLRVIQMNRHNDGIQMLFADWSAKWTGIKALWTYKWHKRWDTNNDMTKKDYIFCNWINRLRQKAK